MPELGVEELRVEELSVEELRVVDPQRSIRTRPDAASVRQM